MINSYFFDAVESGGVYDREYNSSDFSRYLDKLVSNGVFPSPTTNLQVVPNSGRNLNVLAGQGWIDGRKIENTAAYGVTIPTADTVNPRIDAVIFYADYTAREMGIDVLKGTAAATPQPPELTRTSDRYEMCLAQVRVARNATSISAADITDTRGDDVICGYVHGLVRPLTNLQTQRYVHTTSQASESTFDVTELIPEYVPSTDMLEIYISGLRLNADEYSEASGVVTLGTPVTHTGTRIEFVVIQSS